MYGHTDLISYVLNIVNFDENEPRAYYDAINNNNFVQWLEAIKDESKSLHKNNTWVLVLKPNDAKLDGSK